MQKQIATGISQSIGLDVGGGRVTQSKPIVDMAQLLVLPTKNQPLVAEAEKVQNPCDW